MGREDIVWACVARDETKLVEVQAHEDYLSEDALSTARDLFSKEMTIGWDSCSCSTPLGSSSSTAATNASSIPTYKGLRFPVYEMQDGNPTGPPRVWTFACVYNSTTITKRRAQAFLEKIVLISEFFRETDEGWRKGGEHCCNDEFGPIIRQRMQEMKDSSAVADDSLDLSTEIIKLNRVLLNAVRLNESSSNHNKLFPHEDQKQQRLWSNEDSRAPIISSSSWSEKAPPISISNSQPAAFEVSQQPHERVFHSNLRFVAKSKQRADSSELDEKKARERSDSVEDFLQSLEKEACRQPSKKTQAGADKSTTPSGVGDAASDEEPACKRSTGTTNGRRRAATNPTTRAETIALMVVLMLSCLIAILPKSILETSLFQVSGNAHEESLH